MGKKDETMIKSLDDIGLSKNLIEKLNGFGFTEIHNFTEDDDVFLAKKLTKEKFIELAICITKITGEIFWRNVNE